MSTSVVLLAYKEAENLKILLPKIHNVMRELNEPYEILVIDSAEPLDNTQEICEENCVCYIPQEYPAYAGAFRTGIKCAQYEKIQVLDADGSHNPESIIAIHQLFQQGYDIVIGSRYTKGGITHDSKTSIMMSRLLNFVMRICIGVRTQDISTAFRLYDAQLLKGVVLESQNYDVLQEVILKMHIKKKKETGTSIGIGEVPIVFEKRMHGKSKRKLIKFIMGYLGTLFRLVCMRIFPSKEEV